MQTQKMHQTFIHILEKNAITQSTDRSVPGICSLFFFSLQKAADTHPDCWELHTDGDELLMVTKGEVLIEMVSAPYTGEDIVPADAKKEQVLLEDGELVIVPKGHWHRILLKRKTELIVATFGGDSKMAAVN